MGQADLGRLERFDADFCTLCARATREQADDAAHLTASRPPRSLIHLPALRTESGTQAGVDNLRREGGRHMDGGGLLSGTEAATIWLGLNQRID